MFLLRFVYFRLLSRFNIIIALTYVALKINLINLLNNEFNNLNDNFLEIYYKRTSIIIATYKNNLFI